VLDVSPTRMELLKLKRKLVIARRGHKLLKDKLDELVRIVLEILSRMAEERKVMNRLVLSLRREMALSEFATVPKAIDAALMASREGSDITVTGEQVLNLRVPVFSMEEEAPAPVYGFIQTGAGLDEAVKSFFPLREKLLQVVAMERKVAVLAHEIEGTRRRVNALEYILIPDIEETIRSITMKLEEQERNTQIQIMRVKDMVRAPKAQTSAYPGAVKYPV